MPQRRVDLNSDVGEGFGPWRMGDDEALLDIVTTVNVACGFHAGDPLIMARTVGLAVQRGVRVGAHPGFNDLWGYGRRRIVGDAPGDVATMVVYQVGALQAIAARAGAGVSHVKLHGALSHAAAVDAELAAAIANAVHELDPELIWLAPAQSSMVGAGLDAGLRVVQEVFADRGYERSGALASRHRPGSLVEDPAAVAARAVEMVVEGGVTTVDGDARVALQAESICVHGDTPGAALAAREVRAALERAGIALVPFAGAG